VELGDILGHALCQIEALGIPDAVLHNDLNLGNILFDGTNCVFTDWSEAAIGNPFLSLDRFCLLDPMTASELYHAYSECWLRFLSEETIRRVANLASLVSIFTYLYGRGDWLEDTTKVTLQFECYARSLARHMDRAAENPEFREALCH
jgi:aminoglycoside phosphotransferase (APT) family kinase protein